MAKAKQVDMAQPAILVGNGKSRERLNIAEKKARARDPVGAIQVKLLSFCQCSREKTHGRAAAYGVTYS